MYSNHSPIFLPIPLTMQMIKYNKQNIRILEEQVFYLQQYASELWSKCNPQHDSSVYFNMLNETKDEIRKAKKEIKILAEMQYALKYSIR